MEQRRRNEKAAGGKEDRALKADEGERERKGRGKHEGVVSTYGVRRVCVTK